MARELYTRPRPRGRLSIGALRGAASPASYVPIKLQGTPMTQTVAPWFGVAALALVVATSPPASGAPAPKRPAALQAVVDCRAIADNAQRLACFDAAVEKMTQAETSGDLVSVDREERRAVRRQSFGFMLPSLTIFDRGEKAEDVDRLTATLASAWKNSDGKWVFRLDDGAVWRQIDDYDLSRDPHPGSTIVIKRALLGSFQLDVDGQPGLRVHRDN
jgi:hypothetical protein